MVQSGFKRGRGWRGVLHEDDQACPACSAEGHDPDAAYCKYCGAKL